MSIQLSDETAATETVEVACTVSVPRDADGTLADGVRARLETVDGVVAVAEHQIAGLQPGLNDLTVDVEATLRVEDDVDAATLASTFGVRDVTVTSRKGPP